MVRGARQRWTPRGQHHRGGVEELFQVEAEISAHKIPPRSVAFSAHLDLIARRKLEDMPGLRELFMGPLKPFLRRAAREHLEDSLIVRH